MPNYDKNAHIALQVEAAESDEAKIAGLAELERLRDVLSPSRQFALGESVLAAARRSGNTEIVARAQLFCANALFSQSKMQDALASASEVLRIAERFDYPALCAGAQSLLGRIYEETGIHAEALKHLMQALKLYTKIHDNEGIARTYIALGLNYGRQHNYAEAHRQFMQALRLCEQYIHHINPVVLSTAAFYVGHALVSLKQYQQALAYVDRFLPLAHRQQYALGISNGWVIRGDAYTALDRFEDAKAAYIQALDAAERSEMQTQVANVCRLLGELQFRRELYDSALSWLNRAAETAERSESMFRSIQVFELLPKVYIAAERFQDATIAYQRYFELRQKLDVEQQNYRAAVLQAIYQVEGARMESNLAKIRAEALLQEIEQRDEIITSLDSFAHQVAHDLKNPLNIVQNYAIMLQGDLMHANMPVQSQMLDTVVEEVQRMTSIINTMLQIARLRHEDVQPEPVDMSGIVRAALKRIKPMAAQYNAEISIETPLPMAMGIAAWLEEVWFNYLSNAMKYGGIPPRIRIGATDEGDQIRFWVNDNGNGISPNDFDKVFTEFKRLGAADVEGHGVGLSIVKTIVEKLNGKVGVQSTALPGEGATFSFSLDKTNEWVSPVGSRALVDVRGRN
jgi:signal transduction histidine kinase/Tfp pilus assembly protein PilF